MISLYLFEEELFMGNVTLVFGVECLNGQQIAGDRFILEDVGESVACYIKENSSCSFWVEEKVKRSKCSSFINKYVEDINCS